MNPMSPIKKSDINKQVIRIKNKISLLENSLANLQSNCKHPKKFLQKERKGNTGNYDPSQDCYWTEFYCEQCEKSWDEEGSK